MNLVEVSSGVSRKAAARIGLTELIMLPTLHIGKHGSGRNASC